MLFVLFAFDSVVMFVCVFVVVAVLFVFVGSCVVGLFVVGVFCCCCAAVAVVAGVALLCSCVCCFDLCV